VSASRDFSRWRIRRAACPAKHWKRPRRAAILSACARTAAAFGQAQCCKPSKTQPEELVGFAKITRDITERMEAQTALLESESRFRRLVQG
jgi:PAS domain-containing protein